VKALSSLITSKTRVRLLTKFFLNPNNESYLRELSKEFNESTNAVRRELNNLSEAGYLTSGNDQNRVTYKANTDHPLFRPLQNIIRKSLGLESLVEMVLLRLGAVERIILIGDYAEGRDSGTIEVIIEGSEINHKYVSNLSKKIKKRIDREVSFLINVEPQGKGLVIYDAKNDQHVTIATE
jgi:hypothetical protein